MEVGKQEKPVICYQNKKNSNFYKKRKQKMYTYNWILNKSQVVRSMYTMMWL